MHITNQTLSFDVFVVGNLQIFLIYYKYTHATYDWFCGPGSHIVYLHYFSSRKQTKNFEDSSYKNIF